MDELDSQLLGMMWDLRWIVVTCFLVHWITFFAHGQPQRSEKYLDVSSALALWLATTSSYALGHNPLRLGRPQLLTLFVLLWASRLGIYLYRRICRDQLDKRMRLYKKSGFLFFLNWTMKGMWCAVVALPAHIVNIATETSPALGVLDVIGLGLFGVGWAIEVVADRQKDSFRGDPVNKTMFISTGLWAWSRHPNYFGEIVLWCGLALSACSGLGGYLACAVWLSPLYTAVMLRYGNSINMLEEYADGKWGRDKAYIAYKGRTNLLLLWPPREDPAPQATKMLKKAYIGSPGRASPMDGSPRQVGSLSPLRSPSGVATVIDTQHSSPVMKLRSARVSAPNYD